MARHGNALPPAQKNRAHLPRGRTCVSQPLPSLDWAYNPPSFSRAPFPHNANGTIARAALRQRGSSPHGPAPDRGRTLGDSLLSEKRGGGHRNPPRPKISVSPKPTNSPSLSRGGSLRLRPAPQASQCTLRGGRASLLPSLPPERRSPSRPPVPARTAILLHFPHAP